MIKIGDSPSMRGAAHKTTIVTAPECSSAAPIASIAKINASKRPSIKENASSASIQRVNKTKATAQSMEFLHANLTKYHPYVNGTQCAAEFVRENPTATVKVVYDSSKIPAAGHKGTFNKPSSRQGATGVAAILADTAADRQYERGPWLGHLSRG